METVRQRLLLGGFGLAGIGLAVLIGLANPPSPRELVLRAAHTLGIPWQQIVLSDSTKLPDASASAAETGSSTASSESGYSSKTASSTAFSKSADRSASEANPVSGQSTGVLPSPSTSEPGSNSKTSQPHPSAGQRKAWPAGNLRSASPGEVWATTAPAYGEQVPGTPSSNPKAEQPKGSHSSSNAPTPSSENASSPTQQEVPQELLQLWKLLQKDREPTPSSPVSTGQESASEPAPEAPAVSASSSNVGPGQTESNPSAQPSSSRPDTLTKPLSRAIPLSGPMVQDGAEASSPSGPGKHTGPGMAQWHQDGNGRLIINIRNEDIRKVLEMLSEQGNLNILATSSVQGKVSATLTGVDLDSALEAILRSAGYVARREGKFIYVGTPEDFLRMEQAADRIGTRVYRPNYVKAADLKDLIQPLLTEKVGLISVSSPAEIGIASDDDKVGGNNFAGNEAVLVRDYESVLMQIDQVVAEIDVRPMQVHIEAMILSVRLDDTDKFGVDFKKLINNSNFTVGWGMPVDSLSEVTFTKGGLKFGFIDGDVGAFLEALETVGDTNVIAAPRLMVLNKHRADILIGRQEGYVNTTQTETATTQSVQFLDIGTQLRIRPFISPDGLIRMEIHPELSDGAVTVQGNFTLPQKDVTKVTTNIMVRDGCTVVIGGLMQEQTISSINQIPFFGNLPWVGVLFRRKSEQLRRVEIIVLVTPHIVQEPEAYGEGALQQCEFKRRQAVYLEKMSPLGKRSVARRYLRMAQEAWARQDMERALRFAEMAVHFDPLNREALELRAQVWQSVSAGPLPEEALPTSPGRSWTEPLDGPTVAPWIFQELEKSPVPSPSPETTLPEVPTPLENGEGKPSWPPPPTGPLPPAKSNKSSPSPEQKEANPQGPILPNPIRQPTTPKKEIRRPSLFQAEPFRTP